MPFKSGTSGNPKGRPKGLTYEIKGKLREYVQGILKEYNCDPFSIMCQIANGKMENDDRFIHVSIRLDAAKELAQYIVPKLKAVDFDSGEDTKPINVTINLADGNTLHSNQNGK